MKIKRYKEKLEELKRGAKKSLGQNFLVNEMQIERIVKAAQETEAKTLIEIGPGLGALTEPLLDFAEFSTYIELDSQFAKEWIEAGLNVIEADALHCDWSQFMKTPGPRLLVSNLPYQISSRIVIDRCLDMEPLDWMVLMFQKEVAQRLMAKSGDEGYGFLSIMAQSYWDIEKISDLGTQDFYPPPKIASRVLRFKTHQRGPPDSKGFLRFSKNLFSQPRKILVSNLAQDGLFSKAQVLEWLALHKKSEKARPSELSLLEVQDLFKVLKGSR